jgi:hypothetical protein
MKSICAASTIVLAILCTPHFSSADLIVDYFEYGGTAGNLNALTTADTSGWAASNWSGSSAVKYDPAESLTYGGTGYTSNSLGGLAQADGSQVPDWVTRSLAAAASDTVFVSFLARSEFFNASPGRAEIRLAINGDTGDTAGLLSGASQTTRELTINGSQTTTAAAGSGGDRTFLAVLKLETDFSGVNDRVSLWTFETEDVSAHTVAALGPPGMQSDGLSNVWGSSITNFGIGLESPNATSRRSFFDNLRVSSGMITDDMKVYEVLTGVPIPEPSAMALLAVGVAGLLACRRSSR